MNLNNVNFKIGTIKNTLENKYKNDAEKMKEDMVNSYKEMLDNLFNKII